MEEKMMCVRCGKEIEENSNFIEIVEWDKKEFVGIYHMHKKCWESFLDNKKKVNRAFDVMESLFGSAKNQGLVNEVVNIE